MTVKGLQGVKTLLMTGPDEADEITPPPPPPGNAPLPIPQSGQKKQNGSLGRPWHQRSEEPPVNHKYQQHVPANNSHDKIPVS